MEKTDYKQLKPDYSVHPGNYLREVLAARNISQADLARRSGLSEKAVSQMVNQKAPVTEQTAILLERILGISAEIWTGLNSSYELDQRRKKERESLAQESEWAESFPVDELARRGVFAEPEDSADRVHKLLSFFGQGSVAAYENRWNSVTAAYRHSPAYESSKEALACWLRLAEIDAESIACRSFDSTDFRKALQRIRQLTTEAPSLFISKLKDICKNSGVAVTLIPEFRETHISGASFWSGSRKAVIALSLRHKTDDHFWFTFFHEAAHILRHRKKDVFIDREPDKQTGGTEEEANKVAENRLIPRAEYRDFVQDNPSISPEKVQAFAQGIGIAPGIVVGRLQHDGYIDYSRLNHLKRRLDWGK